MKRQKQEQGPSPEPSATVEPHDDREAEPVDAEHPPRLPFVVVGMGASAGGLEAFNEFFDAMPSDSGMAFVLVQHLPPDRESMVAEIIAKHTAMKVHQVRDGMPVEPNHVYVIRPGHTLTIHNGALHLGALLERPRHGRPIDDFFKSLAEEQQKRSICVVMSGMGSNGTAGAQAVKAVGGLCIAQEPESAQFASMPRHLIDAGYSDFILRPADMPEALIGFAGHPYTSTKRDDAETTLRRNEQHVREILAILRTRTNQDFSGYKKPTILRRIQRRMGLNRIVELGDYAKVLRQSPIEVSALADDILIHVTGFFRDAYSWEVLKQRVIAPLVKSREENASVRCWVTACASGEEAYSLAILLVEECERLNKALDIKIFATDTAERTLGNARGGVYPGGIEAEMSPERLGRFFEREGAVYRVRQDLREKVIFAPQNVLRDPPFSRLDIITCRNLLIYLEPEVQQRVTALMHFGLREGGALFLGTSETIAGHENMFEPIDKKARIYRRVGPTRHPAVDFPLPRGLAQTMEKGRIEARLPRPSVAQLAARVLLARHVPAAVVVDRDQRVVYFHGSTTPYLRQPTGEPTRELFSLLTDALRGPVRLALQRSRASRSLEVVSDGLTEGEHPRRITVHVSPLEAAGASELYLISFQEGAEIIPAIVHVAGDGDADELARIREELQNTIEELQASNEEHKASAEEVMSINEELQSSNEELETSKEEMQSLNEELTTVNAQLQAKMEELQNTSNDLTALLSSTDIAVIFLDRQFRIRRFTPAAKAVVKMLDTDVGRPLRDLATNVADPDLLTDARAVLDRLAPIEKEIKSNDERWYLRRILPYRTTDNRIDGVVLTFVDITERRHAEEQRDQSEGQVEAELRVLTATDLPAVLQELLAASTRLLGADRADLQLLEPDGTTLRRVAGLGFSPRPSDLPRLSLGDGDLPWQEALHSLQRVVIEDAQASSQPAPRRAAAEAAGYRAIVCAPLRTRRDALLGVLSAYFDAPHEMSERELRVIELFARHASDMIERLRTEEELTRLLHNEQATRRALDQAAHMKDEFLATLSHELRTPLNVIFLWSRVLRDAPGDIADKAEAINAIVRSAEVQQRLIEDLLDASRIASGKLRLEMKPTDLASVVRSAVEAILPTAASKEVSLEQRVEAFGTVFADPERLHQVLWNVLNNAVKFTPRGGSVRVELERRDSKVEVRVTDTGVGIAPEFLPFIFDRFRQVDAPRYAGGGLGLGLSISKQLVELHGGAIEVDSPGPGKGATFTIRLALAEGTHAARARREAERPGRADKAGAADNPGVADKPGKPGKPGESLQGLRVLLVEDDTATLGVVRVILAQAGAEVIGVATAGQALDAYEREHPDVLVSDIGLPDFDGYELLRRIRALEQKKKAAPAPAIALTAYALDRDRRAARDAGYNVHLAKPIQAQKLITTLSEYVRE